jgi:hypothetical protein
MQDTKWYGDQYFAWRVDRSLGEAENGRPVGDYPGTDDLERRVEIETFDGERRPSRIPLRWLKSKGGFAGMIVVNQILLNASRMKKSQRLTINFLPC